MPSRRERWTAEEANEWYDSHRWIAGCNFIPSYAINQLEMWQEDTFDADVIEHLVDCGADPDGLRMRLVLEESEDE